jgi:Mrp family chromosome partitioning ATPase
VTDASILGRAGDAVLLVLKPDKNDRHSAVRARDTLLSMGCRIVGMAVNDVHPSHTYGYYYYGYGRYGYGYKKYGGYGNEEAATEGESNDDEDGLLPATEIRVAA